MSSLVAQTVKRPATMQETGVQSLGWEYLLEKAAFLLPVAWAVSRPRPEGLGSLCRALRSLPLRPKDSEAGRPARRLGGSLEGPRGHSRPGFSRVARPAPSTWALAPGSGRPLET